LTAPSTSADPFFGNLSNPLINILLPTRYEKSTRLLGNAKADFEVTDGLTLSGNLGADLVSGNNYSYNPVYQAGITGNTEGSTTNAGSEGVNWVADATLKYQKDFGLHGINALVGVSAQQFNNINFSATGTGTTNNLLDQLSNQTIFSASG